MMGIGGEKGAKSKMMIFTLSSMHIYRFFGLYTPGPYNDAYLETVGKYCMDST